MIIVGSTLVSEDLKTTRFVCDISKCKGACCIEGDAGAPLEEEEISLLEDAVDHVKPYMRPEGIEVVEKDGVFDFDDYGHYVTPLVNGKECAFVIFNSEGIAMCAIEQAWQDGKTGFRKPVSCHLYPIRISRYKDFDAVNYHEWHVCLPGVQHGKKLNVPLHVFLKTAITRKYGAQYYEELRKQLEDAKKNKKQ